MAVPARERTAGAPDRLHHPPEPNQGPGAADDHALHEGPAAVHGRADENRHRLRGTLIREDPRRARAERDGPAGNGVSRLGAGEGDAGRLVGRRVDEPEHQSGLPAPRTWTEENGSVIASRSWSSLRSPRSPSSTLPTRSHRFPPTCHGTRSPSSAALPPGIRGRRPRASCSAPKRSWSSLPLRGGGPARCHEARRHPGI